VAGANGRKIIIDAGSQAPLDRDRLHEFASAADATGVLVVSADTPNDKTAVAAKTVSEIGFTRMVITRVDSARYLGATLTAADAAKLALVGASVTPHFGFGFRALTPENLARRLISAAAHPERWRVSPL
jgi:signal recognition particle GTPase